MSMLGNIFKTDSQKLTEAVTGLESLSSQFDELATSVAANAIDSDEFNFRGAAQAIANNISMAGQKVKAGEKIATFQKKMFESDGIDDTVITILLNSKDYSSVTVNDETAEIKAVK